MSDNNTDANITGVNQYYLQVEALAPLDESADSKSSLGQTTSLLDNLPKLNIFIIGFIVTLVLLLSWRMVKLYGYSKTLGMAIMLMAAIGGFAQMNQMTSFSSKASPEFIPREVIVSEVTDSSFSISWNTNGLTVSAVRVTVSGSEVSEHMTYMASLEESRNHSVTVDNLQPKTTYDVEILSGDGWYGDGDVPLKITTQ